MGTKRASRIKAVKQIRTRNSTSRAKAKKSAGRKRPRKHVRDEADEHREDKKDFVQLNIPNAKLLTLSGLKGERFRNQAVRWNYALRNRERWNTQKGSSEKQTRDVSKFARELGLEDEHIARIAAAGIVEIDIPWVEQEDAGDAMLPWDVQFFPWEFMLASVTRELRRGEPLTVVRHLGVDRAAVTTAPQSWLQVISAPGVLASEYDFASERDLLELCVKSFNGDYHVVHDPDASALQSQVGTVKPDVVHLTGFDSHQGLALLEPERDGHIPDGYLVRSATYGPGPIGAKDLARILTSAAGHAPRLISCNIYNSAASIAPHCVAHGAGAAIGFQDWFDDELAELFFSTLYRAWSLADWNIIPAFQYAWRAVRSQGKPLQGSGIILWRDQSILGQPGVAEGSTVDTAQEQIKTEWRKSLQDALTPETVRESLEVDVLPISQLNYSILHNNGPLFERFRIRKKNLQIGAVNGLLVNVELHVGTDSFPFRMQESIGETVSHIDLTEKIRLSLASALSRGIRESIHTSLFVEVMWGETMLYHQTHRVTLLPVDEWRFDAENYRWLPSFVLPRDPAVLRVVDSAQLYLMALRDDATAGFDGYQCVDSAAGMRPDPNDCSMVDMQVRAIWAALLYESPLSYINPPPSFTDSSQRLRTPSDCIDGKRGTCIDLALLLAACLEYVEIYPAIFLLKTHAFPAYWRHDSYHEEFREARLSAVRSSSELAKGQAFASSGQTIGWDFKPSQYREIIGEVQAGRLVPVETTLVTGRGSFADAMANGVQNLASRREFESMLDILLARTDKKASVTPLPTRRGDP